jgi:hypothetical protein
LDGNSCFSLDPILKHIRRSLQVMPTSHPQDKHTKVSTKEKEVTSKIEAGSEKKVEAGAAKASHGAERTSTATKHSASSTKEGEKATDKHTTTKPLSGKSLLPHYNESVTKHSIETLAEKHPIDKATHKPPATKNLTADHSAPKTSANPTTEMASEKNAIASKATVTKQPSGKALVQSNHDKADKDKPAEHAPAPCAAAAAAPATAATHHADKKPTPAAETHHVAAHAARPAAPGGAGHTAPAGRGPPAASTGKGHQAAAAAVTKLAAAKSAAA